MSEEKYIISYDHGTSGMKTALISTKGEIKGFCVEEYELYHPEPGAAEQNPHEWWDALVKTTKDLLSKNLVPIEDIVAVVQSNQMSGTIAIDKDGNTLTNCLTWMDTRGGPMIHKLTGGIIKISGFGITNLLRWLPKTGGIPLPGGKDCIAHILYIKEKHPEIYEKTWKFLDCKDYLAYRLTGKTVTSHDLALFTWCMNNQDVNNIHWDESLIKKTKIDGDKLPDLQPAIHNVGNLLPEIAEELGLSPETKVILGAGDLASAAIGSGGVLDYQPHVCIGTSSWLLCHYERRKIDIFHMIGASTCAIPGRYMVMAEQETAGVNLTWIRDKVLYHKDELLVNEKVPDVYKIFDKLVEETEPGEHKLIFTPWMFGERTPIEDYTVRGSLNNLSLDIDRRHIIRAIFEGVAFNTKWLLKYEEKLVGRTLDDINMVGGGAMSDIWCQIYADILDRTMRQVMNPKEATSMGAAFIASVSLGYIKWEDIPNLVEIKKVFKPRSEYREIYDELYKEFLNIYKNNKKMYARLNKL